MGHRVILPDNILLLKISKSNLYLDKKSYEASTGKTKRKYKLAGNQILDNYFFHILHSDPSACRHQLTTTITQREWENRVSGPYLRKPISYCDLTKHEILERDVLLEKIKDRGNGFPYIAQLCPAKCRELQKIMHGKMLRRPDISKETKSVVVNGLAENATDLLTKLGLS